MSAPDYRTNAIPTCACGARIGESPLLSPATGQPACATCHAKELAGGPGLADPQSRPGEALRHLALSLTATKVDPLASRALACPACGGIARVDEIRDRPSDIPYGRSYRHVCTACGKRFATETIWASVSRTTGASVLFGLAWLFWFMSGTTNDVIAALFALIGSFVVGQRVQRIRNRWFKKRR